LIPLSYSRWEDGKSTATPIFISAVESALAGIAAPTKSFFIHTGLQPGVSREASARNRFNGLPVSAMETVKTVLNNARCRPPG